MGNTMVLSLWMLAALASFCILAIGARELSSELSIAQSLCIRSAIGLIFLSCIYVIRARYQHKTSIKAAKKYNGMRLKLHFFRNIFHFLAQYGWFFGIGFLPLAQVFALEFTVPIWTLLIASVFLNEKITKAKLVAIFLGTLGVVVIVQPGYEIVDMASLVVLGSAVCFAISHTATKSLASVESPLNILLYMCLIQFPIALMLSLSSWVWPHTEQWFWLTIIGLSALSAHYCLAKAMQYAEVTLVLTLDFLRLPLIALVGVLFYNEAFELPLLLGGGLMLLGNLIAIRGFKVLSGKD